MRMLVQMHGITAAGVEKVLSPEAAVQRMRLPASAPLQSPELGGHDRPWHTLCVRLLLSQHLQGIHAVVCAVGKRLRLGSLGGAVTVLRPINGFPSLQGISALMCAAGKGDLTSVAVLLGAGANLDHKDRMGSTAVHAAACRGRLQVVQHLLSSGASLNKQ